MKKINRVESVVLTDHLCHFNRLTFFTWVKDTHFPYYDMAYTFGLDDSVYFCPFSKKDDGMVVRHFIEL